jgi:proteic killer suppression protein
VPIRSYRGKWAEEIHAGRVRPKGFPPDLVHMAHRRLVQLNRAARLDNLRAPPGNRLEALRGQRAGPYSIRINDQWRIVFRWTSDGPADVEIVDYHR